MRREGRKLGGARGNGGGPEGKKVDEEKGGKRRKERREKWRGKVGVRRIEGER